jgi:hypothetical protein
VFFTVGIAVLTLCEKPSDVRARQEICPVRDTAKVAQHFSAGIALRRLRPDRDDRFTLCARDVALETITLKRFDRPSRDGTPSIHLPSNKLLGYYHDVPPGTGTLLLLFPVPRLRTCVNLRPPCDSLPSIRSHTVMPYEGISLNTKPGVKPG